jgi:hypothetical protein
MKTPRAPLAGRCSAPALVAVAAALVAVAMPAAAQTTTAEKFEISMYGPRIGFSSNPDQFTIGAFAGLGEIAPHLSMRPSADLGFGDHIFSFLFNADLAYSFTVGSAAVPYAGAGLGIAYYNFDVPAGVVGVDDSSTNIGLNIFGGMEIDLGNYKNGFAELRLGVDEMPDLKITVGIGFY